MLLLMGSRVTPSDLGVQMFRNRGEIVEGLPIPIYLVIFSQLLLGFMVPS